MEIKTLKMNKKVTGLKMDKKQWKNLKKNTYNNCIKKLATKNYDEKLKIFTNSKKKFKKIKKIKKDLN